MRIGTPPVLASREERVHTRRRRLDPGDGEVLRDGLAAAHADERSGHARRRADELERARGVSLEPRQGLGDRPREPPRELPWRIEALATATTPSRRAASSALTRSPPTSCVTP